MYGDTLSSTGGEITPQIQRDINTILDYVSILLILAHNF